MFVKPKIQEDAYFVFIAFRGSFFAHKNLSHSHKSKY
jgi:hypothetical protein